MLVKKDLVSVIIKHKQRAQALCVLSVFSLAVFIQGKWQLCANLIAANYGNYNAIRKNVPSDTSPENIEFVKWQSDNHKIERDMYLGLATLLSSSVIYIVTFYTDKFDRYMNYKLD